MYTIISEQQNNGCWVKLWSSLSELVLFIAVCIVPVALQVF